MTQFHPTFGTYVGCCRALIVALVAGWTTISVISPSEATAADRRIGSPEAPQLIQSGPPPECPVGEQKVCSPNAQTCSCVPIDPPCPSGEERVCSANATSCQCVPIDPPSCPVGEKLTCNAFGKNCKCTPVEPPDACPGTAAAKALLWKCSQGFPMCVENPNGKFNITLDGGTALGNDWDYPGAAVVFALSMNVVAKVSQTCFVCGCFRLEGCFTPETKLLLADGSERAIEDISAGEYVWNPITRQPARIKQIIQGAEGGELFRFGYGVGALTVTAGHPVLTAAGIKKAAELTFDDSIIDASGVAQPITTLEKVAPYEGQQVINVILEGDPNDTDAHYLVADGIVTGDLTMQLQLADQ